MNKTTLLLLLFLLFSCSIDESYKSVSLRGNIVAFNGLGETLSLIDPSDQNIENDIVLTGISPNHMYHDSEYLYLVNSLSNSITIYDLDSGEVKREVYLGEGKNPWMVTGNSENLYVTCFLTKELLVISKNSWDILHIIEVGTTPQGVYIVGDYLVVTNTNYNSPKDSYGIGSITIINKRNYTDKATLELLYDEARGINPQSLFYIPGSNALYVVCSGDYRVDNDGKIFILNGTTFNINGVINIGGSPSFSQGGIKENRVYLGGIGSIRSFDLITNEIYDPLNISSSDFIPSVIVVDNYIYASMFNRDEVYIFESSLDNRVKTLQGSDGIQQLLYIKE